MAMYPLGYFAIASVRERSAAVPDAAIIIGSYSIDRRSRINSATVGLDAPRRAAESPAQACPRSQMTGIRGATATAAAIRGAYAAGSASAVAIAAENLRNERRDMPRSSIAA